MIQVENITKQFETTVALDQINMQVDEGSIYGLVGSNGAGKSTLLRLLAGIYQPTNGSVTINGAGIYENQEIKGQISYVPDDIYWEEGATMDSTAAFFSKIYPDWDANRYEELKKHFPMKSTKKLANSSKGMRRQAALILALSTMPRYILLDEAFDGLDPILRVALRKILADDVSARQSTVFISSHNLKELEDVCDHVSLLHQGKILLQCELEELKLSFSKIQFAKKPLPSKEELEKYIDILSYTTQGSIAEIVSRGSVTEVCDKLDKLNPILCEGIPLSLEEIFIYEMEAVGYDYSNVIF